jgi:hypothetical protein
MVTNRTNRLSPRVQELDTMKLLALLKDPVGASTVEVARQFEVFHRLAESLPLTSEEFCFAHNWLTSAQMLWEAGDANAAHYQLTILVRKLGL